MRQLLNTLYVTLPDVYLGLQGENIVIRKDDNIVKRFPLHNLEAVVLFTYLGVSPALLKKCIELGVAVSYMTPNGRLIARMQGKSTGNILLRRRQYRIADNEVQSLDLMKNVILAKIHNEKWTIERYVRQYKERIAAGKLSRGSFDLTEMLHKIKSVETMEILRGFEGSAQATYFSVFDEMILNQKLDFIFGVRSRRPPLTNVNALLSFLYSVLGNDIASSLEAVGLDAYDGFMHVDRPGRISLALDLLEELRAPLVDRFVLSLINRKIVNKGDFTEEDSGAVILNDKGRRNVLSSWQERKKEKITHPYLRVSIPWGLVPFVQSMLLARYLRGDLDGYPPFFWK